MKTRVNIFSTNFLIFLLLIPIILFVQELAFKDHLLYGFRDVDWGFTHDYKVLPSFSLGQIIIAWKQWGVYAYQMYYIGIQEQIFGIDFMAFNKVTQFFKFLSVLTIYPLIYSISNKRLISFLTTVVYATASSAVGAMFSVVTSGNYLAVVVMNFFLLTYWEVVKDNKPKWKLFAFSMFLFFITMFLSTERMYPLLPLVLIIEYLRLKWGKTSKSFLKNSKIRIAAFLLPVVLVYIYKPYVVTQFFRNTRIIYDRVLDGNWQLFLTPLISLGGLFLPIDQWPLLGIPTIDSFSSYVNFIWGTTLPVFATATFVISIFLSKKKVTFFIRTMLLTTTLILLVYLPISHWLRADSSLKIHFDPIFLPPVFLGAYVLSICISFLLRWFDEKKDHLLLFIFTGPMVAFLFILATWVASDVMLIAAGVQRYLTIPAIGASMFVVGLLALIYRRMRNIKFIKIFSFLVFFILVPFMAVNIQASRKFFYDELHTAGMIGSEQTRMKGEFWSQVPNFSDTEPSLFYFDESVDYKNGYFHESAVIAGFSDWPLFRGRDVVETRPVPGIIRTNINCVEQKNNCTDFISQYVTHENGKSGIMWANTFYEPENFYAFRLKNKHVINITGQVKNELGLEI